MCACRHLYTCTRVCMYLCLCVLLVQGYICSLLRTDPFTLVIKFKIVSFLKYNAGSFLVIYVLLNKKIAICIDPQNTFLKL